MTTAITRLARLAAAAGVGAALVLGAGGAPAQAAAPSCYGSAIPFQKNTGQYLPSGSAFFTTTANCADINLLSNSPASVRVCFVDAEYCNSWKSVPAGRWTVIASNVKDGVKFQYQFSVAGTHNGQRAY